MAIGNWLASAASYLGYGTQPSAPTSNVNQTVHDGQIWGDDSAAQRAWAERYRGEGREDKARSAELKAQARERGERVQRAMNNDDWRNFERTPDPGMFEQASVLGWTDAERRNERNINAQHAEHDIDAIHRIINANAYEAAVNDPLLDRNTVPRNQLGASEHYYNQKERHEQRAPKEPEHWNYPDGLGSNHGREVGFGEWSQHMDWKTRNDRLGQPDDVRGGPEYFGSPQDAAQELADYIGVPYTQHEGIHPER